MTFLRRHWGLWLVLALIGLYIAMMGTYAADSYNAFETGALDHASNDQPIWNAAHGRGLTLSILPDIGKNRLAMHVEPILFLVALVYRFINDDPRMILWLQTIFLALGAWPVYGLALRRLGKTIPAVLLAAAYLLLPMLQAVNQFDFHAVSFAPFFLLSGIYFLDKGLCGLDPQKGLWFFPAGVDKSGRKADLLPAGLCFLLAVSSKEDIPMLLAMLGLYVFFVSRQRAVGGVLAVLGVAWFLACMYLVIPTFSGGHDSAYATYYEQFGSSIPQLLLSPVRMPGKLLAAAFGPENSELFRAMLLPTAGMIVLGFPWLIPAAPAFALIMFSSNPLMHRVETYHYSAPLLAFIALAGIDGVARGGMLLGRLGKSAAFWQKVLSLLVFLCALGYGGLRGYLPYALSYQALEIDNHTRLGEELAKKIPGDATVVAQAELLPHVDRRRRVEIWSGGLGFQTRLFEIDYYFFDVSHPRLTNQQGTQTHLLGDLAYQKKAGILAADDGYLIVQRNGPRIAIPAEFFSFAYHDLPEQAVRTDVQFGEELKLIGYQVRRDDMDREAEPQLVLYWQVLKKPAEDYHIYIYLLDDQGKPVGATLKPQPLLVWLPTQSWREGSTVRMLANSFPWWTGDREVFGYGLAISRSTDPWDVGSRLSFQGYSGDTQELKELNILPVTAIRKVLNIPYTAPVEILKR